MAISKASDPLVGCRKSFDRFGGLFWPDQIFGGFQGRIEALEFDPGHVGTKLPVDFGLELVARALPGGDFLPQGFNVWNATIQTLAGEHGQLTFGHIEPTAMLGGVVKFELAGDSASFRRGKDTVQGRGGVGVEIIHDQPDAFGRWEVDIDQ